MKRMTNTELNTRIAQFIGRKKEHFPEIFDDFETARRFEDSLPNPKLFSGRGFGAPRPRYT